MISEFQLRQQICDIGHRIWLRGYCSGNEGNISVRIGKNSVLCTPTMISKGFMKPGDLCKVDMSGKQIEGNRRRTSEILLHLEIYKAREDIKAIIHCHPPHLTAFAIARREIPLCIIPEMEIMVGHVPIAEYATPGTDELAKSILEHVDKSNTVLLANHGVVCWSKELEMALFNLEVADSYCRTLLLAAQLGGATQIPEHQVKDLLKIKQAMGITDDPRLKLQNCDMCSNDQIGRGIVCSEGGRPETNVPPEQLEALIQKITDQVMKTLAGKSQH